MVKHKLNEEIELSTKEAADYLGCSPGFLCNDRIGARRVPFIKIFGKIRYRLSDLEKMKVYYGPAGN